MSQMQRGGCGVLLGVAILVAVFIVTTILFPTNPVVTFAILGFTIILILPLMCQVGSGRYRVVGRGGYDWSVEERSSTQSAYRELDTSQISRVVIDDYSGEEHVISGSPEMTYRRACVRNWDFDSISKKGPWIVISEKGNDITDQPLSGYDGIARIKSTVPMDRRIPKSEMDESSDKSDEYSSMDAGVEFYD